MPIQYDKSALNDTADLGTFEITEQMVRDYAVAVGAPDPGSDGEAAPCFCNILIAGADRPKVQIEGGRRRFMAGQSYEPLAPVRAGDRLTGVARIADIYEKTGRSGSMLFVVRETTFTNQNDVDVAKIRHSAVIQE